MKDFDIILKKVSKYMTMVSSKMSIYSIGMESDAIMLTKTPYKYVNYHHQHTTDDIESIFNTAIACIPLHAPFGEDTTRQEVLMKIALGLHVTPFAVNSNRICLPVYQTDVELLLQHLNKIDKLFYKTFQTHIVIRQENPSAVDILEKRMDDARLYYIEEHGEWTSLFMEKLGDTLSKDSFATFLRQRIKTHIMRGSLVCYPIEPPIQSGDWRKQREAKAYDFPTLEGCVEDMRQLFFKDTFVYEQYAIPGLIEAAHGNTVIDAGAFVGDTACYFSRKVGESGKVFAFEIVPETVDFAKKNMTINGCKNVEIIQKALSDSHTTFNVVVNPYSNSAAFISDSENSAEVQVEAVTLDDFVKSRNIKLDFVKADIEGAELQMLRGGAHSIANDAPICAICLYHRQEDYWQIPQYLAELCSDYMFWFRCEAEPVLFAKRSH